MRKALGVVPARFGSTRFPGKPLAPLLGRPMIERTLEAARQARSLDHVVVATDDDRIRDAVRAVGGDVVMTSPACASGTDRVAEVCALPEYAEYSVAVNVQGDEPGVDPAHIDLLVEELWSGPSSSSLATLASPIADESAACDRNVVKVVVDRNGRACYFSRALVPHSLDGRYQVRGGGGGGHGGTLPSIRGQVVPTNSSIRGQEALFAGVAVRRRPLGCGLAVLAVRRRRDTFAMLL